MDTNRPELGARSPATRLGPRIPLAALLLAVFGGAGLWAGTVAAAPTVAPTGAPVAAPNTQAGLPELTTLRLYGDSVVCDGCIVGQANRPATAGSDTVTDPNTGRVPEDPPYTDPRGPFSPLSPEAPNFDFVTWDPAWISERLGEPSVAADWDCANGIDEVSAASNIRAGGVNGAEKVWLRHWYEPTHLDKDLNADDCLTDNDFDGQPDAPVNPTPSNDDEWYPAIMTELTYLLTENELPIAGPTGDEVDDQAPRPTCGAAGATRWVFPVGTFAPATDPLAPAEGQGLTSLDADFDGDIDMINVTSERELAADLGLTIDFDGDGVVDDLDPAGPLSCDAMVVMHTDTEILEAGEMLQFLDHFVRLRSASGSSASLEIWYSGDLQPRLVATISLGQGSAALAGDVGPIPVQDRIGPGGDNLGTVPRGSWFVYLDATDAGDNTATVMVGRALGAPCASMEDGPNTANLSPGAPWFLKRFYVDGHEYNVVAIQTCSSTELQYLTLRAPLPKVPVTIEQHSVRLEPYAELDPLVLPPPFNHEHTILEDVVVVADDQIGPCPVEGASPNLFDPQPRPEILYMGGPVGPVPPILSDVDGNRYMGRDPNAPVGPYQGADFFFASRWFYVDEDVNPQMLGQLREKYGAEDPLAAGASGQEPFFFNEQMWTRPWNYTEFYLPNQSGFSELCEPDAYHVTTGFTNPTSRGRLWSQPDDDVPDNVPPTPPDLVVDNAQFDEGTGQYGAPQRAGFVYDPDRMDPVYTNDDGLRLHGGYPRCPDGDCTDASSRPDIVFGAGDVLATDPAGLPVEVPPYTDPFAPFNPQAPDAPRGDLLTFNPAYMDEFRNFGEALRLLYQQISNAGMNARQKVYQRTWYQPEYVTKLRETDDCDADLVFPAVMQEFTYLMMDTTDNPVSVPVPGSRMAFPIAVGAAELPRPNLGGTLPAGGGFGYGLTGFDADWDGFPDAVGLHTEASANEYFSSTFAANRPQPPIGVPVIPLPGAMVDFDGDGLLTDTLDADCVSLNGNEMVVLTVESIVLDAEAGDPAFGHAAMMLDHLVTVENVTSGTNPRAQLRFYFTGGTIGSAVPEQVGGTRTLNVGSVAVVDRFQDSVTVIEPGETNAGMTDGAWFVFVESVSEDGERVTLTLGRALGATHSAIDDGAGRHDLTPGDPWYLKRFYVDGHEYNVVALMTRTAPDGDPSDPAECNDRFAFLTIRTPVPKGNYFNPQDSLFQQGYFLDELPPQMSVMPPYNADHTIAVDVERMEEAEFANQNFYDACVGELAAAGPQEQRITEEEPEERFAHELRETYRPGSGTDDQFAEDGWETHQQAVTPGDYTEIALPEGERYLLTLNWRSPVSRLAFYGCTRADPGPFDDENDLPGLSHSEVAAAGATWDTALIPPVNRFDPPFLDENGNGIPDYAPFFDARCSVTETVRVKLFYDPTEDDDLYVNKRPVDLPFLDLDAAIEKTAGNLTPVAGGPLTYTIEVSNNGPDDIPAATVVDMLPPGVSYVSDTDGCVPAGSDPDVLTCSVGLIPSGGSESFQITVLLDEDFPPGTTLVNVATVTVPGALDPNPDNDTDDAVVTPVFEADLRVTKSAPASTVVAGTSLTYQLTVINGGPSSATDVVMTDELPPEAAFVSSSRPDLCTLFGGTTLVCTVGDLAAGAAVTVDVTVDVPPNVPAGTLLENDVTVEGSRPDPDPTNDEDDADVIVVAEADLALSKDAEPNPVTAGESLTFNFVVSNLGPSDVGNAQVVDTLPAGVTFVGSVGAACSGVANGGTGTLTCQVGAVPAGGSVPFAILVDVDADVPAGSQITNEGTVSAPGTTDPDPGNNTDDAVVDVIAAADLSLTKDGPDEVFPGTEFDWTVTVFNGGPSDAVGVVISDTIPAGTTYVSASGAACGGVAPGGTGTLVCAVGPLAVGASADVVVRLRVDDGLSDGTVLTNDAVVGADTPDPDSGNNDATDTITVRVRADLAIIKDSLDPAVAGGSMAFELTISNAGPSTATGVLVTDTLPAGMSFTGSDPACVEAPPASGALSCALPDILPAGMATVVITVSLDADLAAGTVLLNRAGVGATTPDPDLSNNTDDESVTVARLADLRIAKVDGPDPVVAGTTLRYTLTVTNDGPSDAANVEVVDVLPANTSFQGSSIGCVEAPSGTIRCGLGTLAAGATTAFTVDVLVDSDVPGGDMLVNQATVDSDEPDPSPGNNSDSESTTVVAEADLAIEKRASQSPVVAGENFAYTIVVTNTGPSAAPDVVVVDVLPAGLTHLNNTGGCLEAPAGTLTCNLGLLPAGSTTSFSVVVTVAADVADGTLITNTAVVDSGADDPDPSNNSDDDTVVVAASADLAVEKSAPAMAEPDEQIAYGLTVTNNGPSDAVNVVVTDTLPVSVTFVMAVGASCVEAPTGTITCDLGDLGAMAVTAFNIVVVVDSDAPAGGVLRNIALVGSDTPDPESGNNEDEAQTTVDPRFEADLRLTKDSLEATPGAGTFFSYRIMVFNDGPRTATGVVVTDTLPAGVSYQFDSDSCVQGPVGTLVCSLPDLMAGAFASFTITVRVDDDAPAGAVLTNTATTGSDVPDPNPGNNTDTADVTIVPRVDLAVTKTGSENPVAAGALLTYGLLVENLGPSDATGVVVTDTLPAGVSYLSDGGGCDASGLPVLVCTVGPLSSGASTLIEIVVRVGAGAADGATLTNTVVVGGNEDDPEPDNNDDSLETDVERVADLAISKDVSRDEQVPGGPLTYTLTVNNLGPSDTTGVLVTDTLPAGTSYVSDDAGCDASGEPTISCTLGNLAAGATVVVTIVVQVDPGAAAGTLLDNVAEVGGDNPDPDPSNNEDEARTVVTTLADLRVLKSGAGEVVTGPAPDDVTVTPNAVTAGRRLTYTLSVTNGGPTDATGVTVTDTLPAGVSYANDDAGCDTFGLPALRCDIGALAAGSTVIITIGVDVDADVVPFASLINTVVVGGDDPDPNLGNNDDDQTTLVLVAADLGIEKVASPSQVTTGDPVVFSITVTNYGPSLARDVLVEDTLPMSLTYVSDSAGCDTSGLPTLSCLLGDLAPGASTGFDITATVEAGLAGQSVSNTASVQLTGGGTDPNPSNDQDTDGFDVVAEADLALRKTGEGAVVVAGSPPGLVQTPNAVTAGERLTYTLLITNTGPSPATAVVVTDTLPAGTSFVSGAGCDASAAPVIVCAVGSLAAGAATSVVIVVDVAPDVADGSSLLNTAEVGANEIDPDPSNNSDDQTTIVSGFADLAVVKIADPTTVGVGELVTFTITVANGGPSTAFGVVLTDTLPAGLLYESDDAGCDTSGLPLVVCALGDMPSGAVAVVELAARAEASGADQTVTNTARVALSDGADPDPSNDEDDATVGIRPLVDLSVAKAGAGEVVVPGSPPGTSILPNSVTAGRRLTYTLTASNVGPSTATNVVLTDTLPSGVSFVSAGGASCNTVGLPTLVCNLPDLSAGGMAVVVVVVDVDADVPDGTLLTNLAGVRADEADADPSDNTVSQETDVSASADIAITKTATPDDQAPLGLVTYTLLIQNLGPSDADGVVVTDTLPADTTYVSDDGGCDTSALPTVVCSVGSLAAGASTSIEIVVQVDLTAAPGASLTNSATVGADTDDPDPSNDTDTATTTVIPQADLRIVKSGEGEVVGQGSPPIVTLQSDTVTAGRVLSYTLTVINGGPSSASGIVFTDTLPSGMTHLSDDAGCDASAPPLVVCAIGGLAVGSSASVVVRVQVDSGLADGAQRINTVLVTAVEDDPDTDNNDAQQTTTVLVAADLAIVKTADPSVAVEGQQVVFTMDVTNNGPSLARDVVVEDTLPISLTYVSDSAGCDTSGLPTLSCMLGDLAAGASTSFDITATVEAGLAGRSATNTATVQLTGGGSDPDPSNDTDDAIVVVREPDPGEADLAIDKTGEGEVVTPGSPPTVVVTPDAVSAGRRLTWTLFVSNAGPAGATGVTVTDTLPAGTSYVSDSAGCDTSALPVLVCALPNLAAGANTSFQIVADTDADLLDGSVLDNMAVVGGSTPDGNPSNDSATHRTVVGAVADLVITKTADPRILAPGDATTFTLRVTNLGPSVARGIAVTDVIPAGLTYVSDDAGCDATGLPTLTCGVADLGPGAFDQLRIVATATGATDTAWINTATVDLGGGSDPDPSNNSDSDTVEIRESVTPVDLSIDKTGAGEFVTSSTPPGLAIVPGIVTAGRRLTYTLTVRNEGAVAATGIRISDTLPAGVTFVAASTVCDISGAPVILCDAPNLGPGAMATVAVSVDVSPDVVHFHVLHNEARVDAEQPDENPGNNEAAQDTVVFVSADLAVTKTAEPGVIDEGAAVTFVLTATNLGPSLGGDVVVSDTLPAGLTYTSDDGACDTSALPTILCDAGDLAPGASAVIRIMATAAPGTAGQTLTNEAEVQLTGGGTDPDPANDTDSADVDVDMSAAGDRVDLAIDKTGAGAVTQPGSPPGVAVVADQVTAGNRLTYTLSVSNAGVLAASGVVVTDTLPAGTTFVSADVPCDTSGAPIIVCTVGAVAGGGNAVVTLLVDVAPGVAGGSVLQNDVTVGGDQPDDNPGNDEASQSTTVSELADLALTKTAEFGVVEQGELITFSIRVDNLGPSLGRGVRVLDTLPAGLTYESDDAGCDTTGLPVLSCELGDIAVGGTASFQLVARATGAAGETVTNGATAVLTGGGDPDPSNNTDTASVDVVDELPDVDLRITKSGAGAVTAAGSPPLVVVIPDQVTAGARLTYTLSVINDGPDDATGVVVSDSLPAGTLYVSDDAACDTSGLPQLSCTVGDLANGAGAAVIVVVDVDGDLDAGTVLTNSTGVRGLEPDPDPSNNTAEQQTTVGRWADLELSKRVDPTSVAASEAVTFTLAITNNGPSTARSVVVTDTLPAGMSFDGSSPVCDTSGLPILVCALGDLAAAGTAVVEIYATATLTLTGQVALNVARTASDTPDPDPSNNADSAEVAVGVGVDLAIHKTGVGEVVTDGSPPGVALFADRVSAGLRMTWTLAITNTGLLTATNVAISDTLPVSVTYVTDSAGCDTSGLPLLACDLGDLGGGASTALTVVVDVDADAPAGSQLVNRADVAADQAEVDVANNTSTHVTDVDAPADLALTKDGAPPYATTGDAVTFALEVVNDGPALARDVRVTDTLPAGLSYLSDTDSCVQGPVGTLACDLGNILPGASAAFDIVAVVDGGFFGSVLTNTATSSQPNGGHDPDPSNDTDEASVRIVDPAFTADLFIKKSITETLPIAGELITYTVTVINNGPIPALNTVVSDTLTSTDPAAVRLISTTLVAGCVRLDDFRINCALGDIPSGGRVDYEVTGQLLSVPGAGQPALHFTNTVIVDSDTPDLQLDNNTGFAFVEVLPVNVPMSATAFGDGQAFLTWEDVVEGETDYLIEGRGGSAPFAPLAVVPPGDGASTGDVRQWLSGPLPAGRDYAFRVIARGAEGEVLAAAGRSLHIDARSRSETACVDGQVRLPGRGRHGAWLAVDGLPLERTAPSGAFQLCGLPPGVRVVSAFREGWLRVEARPALGAGSTAELPTAVLPAGDHNGDGRIDVVDLVRVAARFGRAPVDRLADLDGDGRVGKADLLLVAAWLDYIAPRSW